MRLRSHSPLASWCCSSPVHCWPGSLASRRAHLGINGSLRAGAEPCTDLPTALPDRREATVVSLEHHASESVTLSVTLPVGNGQKLSYRRCQGKGECGEGEPHEA